MIYLYPKLRQILTYELKPIQEAFFELKERLLHENN